MDAHTKAALKVVIELYETLAHESEWFAKAWQKDPDTWKADAETIGIQLGRVEAFKKASAILGEFINAK